MGQPKTTRARSIRWHLFQVLLVTIIPVGLFAAGLFYLHWQAQERQRELSQIESVRLLAAAVDNAVDSTVQRLSIFARIWGAGPANEALLHAQARQALDANPDWINVVAFRAEGTGVFRADETFGAAVQNMRLLQMWRPVVAEGRPVVTDVFTSPHTRARQVAIGVPVVRDGKVTHVLIANLNLRWFDELLTRQGAGGIAGIFDRYWKFIARGAEGEARRGSDGAASLIEDMKRRPEGIGRYTSLNGDTVFTSWTPTRHGWWVAFATPSAPVDSAFRNYLTGFGALWLLAVGAGIAFAFFKGQRIAGALESLEARAAHLGAGRPLSGLEA